MTTLPKHTTKRFIFTAGIGLAALAFFASSAVIYGQAIPLRTMTVVPPTFQRDLDPGGKAEGVMKVTNDSDEPLTFNAVVRDFIVTKNDGTPEILPPNTLSNKYSAASWVGVSPSTFTVAPHTKQELNFFIQVPADARPGGHYAAVMYTPTTNVQSGISGASVETQLGTLFYIKVNGPISEKAEIIEFSTKGFQEYGPVTVTTEIRNLGDYHIRPAGTITLSNMFNQVVDKKNIDGQNIFPEASRVYENTFNKGFMIGRYTAKFMGTYGANNNLPLVATVTFWVFPWKIAIVVLLLVVLVILGILLAKKRRNKKNDQVEQTATTQPVTQ